LDDYTSSEIYNIYWTNRNIKYYFILIGQNGQTGTSVNDCICNIDEYYKMNNYPFKE